MTTEQKEEMTAALATLILFDDGVDVNSENIGKVIAAANGKTAPYWPKLFESLMKDAEDPLDLLLVCGGGGGGGGGAAAAEGDAAGAAAPAAEKEKEESSEEESEADMGFSLFD